MCGQESVCGIFKGAGLPAPECHDNAFMLNVTIRNSAINETNGAINDVINEAINLTIVEKTVLEEIAKMPNITKEQLHTITSLGKSTIDRAIKSLKEKGFITRVGSNKTGHWKIVK